MNNTTLEMFVLPENSSNCSSFRVLSIASMHMPEMLKIRGTVYYLQQHKFYFMIFKKFKVLNLNNVIILHLMQTFRIITYTQYRDILQPCRTTSQCIDLQIWQTI